MATTCGLLLLGVWLSGHLKAEYSGFHTLPLHCMWDKGKASLGGALEHNFFIRAPMSNLYWLHVDLGKGRERHSICLSLSFCEEV